MVKISAGLIKELRKRTHAGVMECKQALVQTNGNIDLAIISMRKSGQVKAIKKSHNATTNGLILIDINREDDCAVLLELNCQTDFVAKHEHFKNFGHKLISAIIEKNINTIEILKKKYDEERMQLVSTIGENININRFSILQGKNLGGYLHNSRIGVLLSAENLNCTLMKQISMHIAASKPEYLSTKYIPEHIIDTEYKIQYSIASKTSRSLDIIKKIVSGRMEKFKNEIALENQNFILNQDKTIGEILKENNAKIFNFIRYEIGENI